MSVDLVVGLGNPGVKYAGTRHNVGFDVLAEVQRRRVGGRWLVRPECELAVITPGRFVVLARPLSFMNRSGGVIRYLLAEYGFEPRRMLVVVDDIDLPLGALRVRPRGGPGTHNGLRDICREVGTDFPRLRVGIRGAEVSGDLADFVTGPFEADEVDQARSAILCAADAVEHVVQVGVERAMNTVNRRQQ